jgi:hypothetical protein
MTDWLAGVAVTVKSGGAVPVVVAVQVQPPVVVPLKEGVSTVTVPAEIGYADEELLIFSEFTPAAVTVYPAFRIWIGWPVIPSQSGSVIAVLKEGCRKPVPQFAV